MAVDHAADSYLEGLSPLDRARATVAVRWCGAKWASRGGDGRPTYRYLSIYGAGNTACSVRHVIHERAIDGKGWPDWGTNWTGTASLMELAESRGWVVWDTQRGYDGSYELCLQRNGHGDHTTNADTIHAAVLLACAAAAQREVTDGE